MSVTVASRLERLVRFVPGVAGYQDRENSRTTDKQVRMRLVQEIGRLIKGLDDDKERIAKIQITVQINRRLNSVLGCWRAGPAAHPLKQTIRVIVYLVHVHHVSECAQLV